MIVYGARQAREHHPQHGTDGHTAQHLAQKEAKDAQGVGRADGQQCDGGRVQGDRHAVVDQALAFDDDGQAGRCVQAAKHRHDRHGVSGRHDAAEEQGRGQRQMQDEEDRLLGLRAAALRSAVSRSLAAGIALTLVIGILVVVTSLYLRMPILWRLQGKQFLVLGTPR